MKGQIRKLVDLQKIDGQIHQFKNDLKEKPLRVEELKEQFENTKTHLHELEEKGKTIELSRKEHELNLKAKEDDIAKGNAQLSELKTNKEYTAKISEIESAKADKSVFEEKVLISFDESDAVNKEIEAEKQKVAEEEKNFLAKKAEVDDEVKGIEGKLKTLDAERQTIVPEVEKEYIDRYEKILGHKDGLAIVPIKNMICGGCFININPQMINAIKMDDSIVDCQMCSRILYLEDDD